MAHNTPSVDLLHFLSSLFFFGFKKNDCGQRLTVLCCLWWLFSHVLACKSRDGVQPLSQHRPASENIDIAWLTVIFEAGVLQHLSQITVHPYRSDSPETALADFNVVRKLVDEYSPVSPTNAAGSSMRRSSSSVHDIDDSSTPACCYLEDTDEEPRDIP